MKVRKWSMHKFTNLFTIIILVFALSSCEENISVDLPPYKSKIVVEGFISSGEKPYVLLSKNQGYFDPLDSSSLLNYTVKGALVIVSDGLVFDTLVEVDPSVGYYYQAYKIIGIPGNTYNLFIIAEGETLSAVTQIPIPVPLDSVWFKVQDNLDSLGFAWAHLNDPPQLGTSYRWLAKRIGKDDDYIPPPGSVFDDKFFNGLSFDFAYNRGEIPNSTAEDDNNEESGYFKKGDVIAIKFCTIDRSHFDFWRTYDSQVSNYGNPFSSPTPIKGNIKGGLGIWGGYGVSLDTIYAQ
jgi:hypothetical protein